jgi:DNA-binding beta-propeller fold protein YncE
VSGGDSVTPINVATQVVGAAIDVGTTAEALAVTPGGATAWVCGANGLLVHVELADGKVIKRINVGNQPSAVVIAGGEGGAG